MAITQFVTANNVNTQLAAAASATATTLTLSSSANLPTLTTGQAMPLTLNDAATGQNYEIIYVTAITGVTLTVIRGQEGTGALTWNVGDYAFCPPTAGTTATTLGNPSNTFQVAAATVANQAPQLGQVQGGGATYALDTGTANTYTVAYAPAITAVTDGLRLRFKAKTANTGASTFSPNGLTAAPIWGAAHSALQGGEIVANSDVELVWNSSLNTTGAWVLLESTGGPLQVAPATASQHAVQLGQVAGVVGSARNLKMSVAAASASATLTADEIIVETALGGLRYCLASFNKTINLATTGAGGMDTGSAPVSGYVALYAIYNATTQTSALLATNATSSVVGNVYGGANMPAGYTASALVSVWPTNGSGQFIVAYQSDRQWFSVAAQALNTTVQQASATALSISSIVPPNAKTVNGSIYAAPNTSGVTVSAVASGSVSRFSEQGLNYTSASGSNASTNSYNGIPLVTQQTMYYLATVSSGTLSYIIYINGYTF
jgi:hypothetical protein